MCRSGMAVGLMALLATLSMAQTPNSDEDWVIVVPQETDAILANPGMGWETFHRTANEDKNLPDWIPSTVHYARWGWGELEPVRGKIDYAFLDKVLQESRESGQTLAFRAMCCSTTPNHPYQPGWLEEAGGRILTTRYQNGPELTVPDLDDPVVLAAHLDFIKRLGARYDGHPDLEHVDLGSVGWWGEWHMSNSSGADMPTPENQKKIVDAYLAAFQKTPLVMLIGGGDMLKYATAHGAGWRADCLGDMGGFSKTWCHMRMAYPKMLPAADAMDVWRSAPVAWETCWDMRKWVEEGWSLRYIFNYALALHGSVINNKSAPLPEGDDVRKEVERFLRRLGYRLVLKELKHPRRISKSSALQLAMKWQNVGSAPCYRPYRLAYRLTSDQGQSYVVVGDVKVNQWMPGSVEVFDEQFLKQPADLPLGEVVEMVDRVALPKEIAPGSYVLSIGVVASGGDEPVVQLGIQTRDASGWYPLTEVRIVP